VGVEGAPTHYVLTETVARVFTEGSDDPVFFETFAAAAADAFNNELKTVTITQVPDTKDVYKMPGGSLNVKIASGLTGLTFDTLKNKYIVKDGGDDVFLGYTVVGSVATFTVSGIEATIFYASTGTDQPYDTIEEAIVDAKNKPNLVVTPTMSLDRELSFAAGEEAPVNGDWFILADSEYDVNLTLDGFEVVADQSGDAWKVTFKTAVATVDSDVVDHYDSANNPVYVQVPFAEFADAIAYAGGEKLIRIAPTVTAEKPVEYTLTETDVFWVADAWDVVDETLILSVPSGKTLRTEFDEDYENAKFFCSNHTITLYGGGGETAEGERYYVVDAFAVGDWIDLDNYKTVFTKKDDAGNPLEVTGFRYNGSGVAPDRMPNADISYTAQWSVVKKVTINWANDNDVIYTTEQYPGEELLVVGLKQLSPVPTKEGYRLDEDNLWTPEVPELVPEKSMIFNLNWIEQEKVSFFYDNAVQAEIFVDKGSKLADNPDVPAPTKTDKELKWTLNGADYDMSAPVNGDLTLVGEWVPKTFTVTFENEEGAVPDGQLVAYGDKATDPGAATTDKVGITFVAWYEQGKTNAFDFNTPITKDTVLEAVWEPATAEVTVDPALEVHQTIGIKFYVQPSEWADPSNITVNVAYTSKYQTVNNTYTLSELTPINGEYEIKAVDTASDEMSDTVTLTIKEGDKEIFKQEYTIASIANEWLADEAMQQYWPLLKAMLQYGDKAQGFFNNHPDQHITPAGAPALVAIPATFAPGEDPTTLADYIEYCQFGINLETAVGMNIYIKPKDGYGINDITVTVTDKAGKAVATEAPIMSGSEIKITVPGFYPEQLLNDYNVTVTVNGVSATYVRSVMTCAYVLEQKGTAVELLEALYQYSLAAQGIWG
jgi:hypothetical protein